MGAEGEAFPCYNVAEAPRNMSLFGFVPLFPLKDGGAQPDFPSEATKVAPIKRSGLRRQEICLLWGFRGQLFKTDEPEQPQSKNNRIPNAD